MIELKLITSFPHEIIALDEVGRSPLSGPVVIGGIRLKVERQEDLLPLHRYLRRKKIKDSKLLTTEMRQEILSGLGIEKLPFRVRGEVKLKGLDVSYVTWDMGAEVIDRENILNASLRGMKEAAVHLSWEQNTRTTLLIDGHMKLRWEGGTLPWTEIPIVKGDQKSALIGLASIIAKERRDEWMRAQHEIYPVYGFDSHVGYPTKEHREALAQHGPCPIHRLSFNKVKEFAKNPKIH